MLKRALSPWQFKCASLTNSCLSQPTQGSVRPSKRCQAILYVVGTFPAHTSSCKPPHDERGVTRCLTPPCHFETPLKRTLEDFKFRLMMRTSHSACAAAQGQKFARSKPRGKEKSANRAAAYLSAPSAQRQPWPRIKRF